MSIKINDKNLSKMYIGTPITDATKIQMSNTDSKTVAEAINENIENITQLNKSLSSETTNRTTADNALREKIATEEQLRSQADTNLKNQITENKKAENINITEATRTLYDLTVDNANVDNALQTIWTSARNISIPTGMIMWFTTKYPPLGFIYCNGGSISRITYAKLFSIIGTTYGAGDGSTSFNLPDLRGAFIRGIDDGKGIDVAITSVGQISQPTLRSGGMAGYGSPGDYPVKDFDTNKGVRPYNMALLPCIKY